MIETPEEKKQNESIHSASSGGAQLREDNLTTGLKIAPHTREEIFAVISDTNTG